MLFTNPPDLITHTFGKDAKITTSEHDYTTTIVQANANEAANSFGSKHAEDATTCFEGSM